VFSSDSLLSHQIVNQSSSHRVPCLPHIAAYSIGYELLRALQHCALQTVIFITSSSSSSEEALLLGFSSFFIFIFGLSGLKKRPCWASVLSSTSIFALAGLQSWRASLDFHSTDQIYADLTSKMDLHCVHKLVLKLQSEQNWDTWFEALEFVLCGVD
jgi:hypothetical protein